ncbi:hypothetical protein [Kaistia sp. MMO-174]|uniref:hypothetical protein n=1 Tax=Kaistia sp. MMO-174 TaxID=3081256 RepID=UPI003015DE25
MANDVPAFASAHIIRAYQATGLTAQAFADWLRAFAAQVDANGERALETGAL